jgi:hypothetical protein
MKGLGLLLGVALLCPLAGCGASDDGTEALVKSYRESLRRERENQQKLLAILESVKDLGSMPEGLERLRKLYEARPPLIKEPPPELHERLRPELESLRKGGEAIERQIERIRELPHGKAFLIDVERLKNDKGPKAP